MPNENTTRVIEIKKLEMTAYETGSQYKITASDGVKYKFYDKKKDGNPTVAFKQFQDMGLKMGMTVEVWFKELQKEYEGKPYTDRIIASFREAKSKPLQIPTQAPIAVPSANSYATEPKSQEFWDERGRRLALHGFINARLQNHTIKEVSDELVALLALEDDVNKILDKKIEFDDAPTPTDAPPIDVDENLPPF